MHSIGGLGSEAEKENLKSAVEISIALTEATKQCMTRDNSKCIEYCKNNVKGAESGVCGYNGENPLRKCLLSMLVEEHNNFVFEGVQ
jgi:hypothetical protein